MLVGVPPGLGAAAMSMIERMYPICRSITGDGVRRTLAIVSESIDLEVEEVPSGSAVLDWTVPLEWNIRDAYIADPQGARVVDFAESNLHVVSYSVPVDRRMTLDELRPHLHSLPDQPTLVPYRTTYYTQDWGFCLREDTLASLPDVEYHVVIDSTLAPGSLTYGEFVVPGVLDEEILLSTHVCHPSLCDDNLTGIAVAATLAAALAGGTRPRHTFRFVFAPGTIGAITWLARNRDRTDRIVAGMTLTCLGDDHPFTYKRTEAGDAIVDRAAAHVLAHSAVAHDLIDFFPYGYDERQYNSPGFRIGIGSLMRGRHGRFPEYHTSADDLTFVSAERVEESFRVVSRILGVVDRDRTLRNTEPFGEPQLGGRGLYRALGGTEIADAQLAMLWVLNQSDGTASLLDIAERAGVPFETIAVAAELLEAHGLLSDEPA